MAWNLIEPKSKKFKDKYWNFKQAGKIVNALYHNGRIRIVGNTKQCTKLVAKSDMRGMAKQIEDYKSRQKTACG